MKNKDTEMKDTEFFISYNHKDELWYSYTDGKINKVENMDINAIPLVLVYQIKKPVKRPAIR